MPSRQHISIAYSPLGWQPPLAPGCRQHGLHRFLNADVIVGGLASVFQDGFGNPDGDAGAAWLLSDRPLSISRRHRGRRLQLHP